MRRQQKQNDQHWNIYSEVIEDTDSKKTENDTVVVNLHSLHDPYDLNNIHGLRKRLFITFNEFSNILNNALLPPVLKSAKKRQIKNKECDQPTNNYILDLNSLLSEIKKESKNEDLHSKKNKNNVTLRKGFQIKLIKCYKLAIDATKICSKTLEAEKYNPIQSKMKNLIKIISALSLITGKYIYGEELYKKKKKESFDLVQHCKDLDNMLEESGYKDKDNDNYSNNIDNNILNELSKKALSKPAKTQLFSANSNRLSMYYQDKPKLGSHYAQGWSKKSFELTRNKVLSKKDNIILKTENNLDNVKTKMEDYPLNETNYPLCIKEIQNEKLIDSNEEIKFPTASKVLKSDQLKKPSNVGFFIMKHDYWKSFPIKNLRLSQNENILLSITQKDAEDFDLDQRRFKEYTLRREHDDNIVSNVTESIIDDLIHEVLSKIDFDAIIMDLIKMELMEWNCFKFT